MHRFGGKWTDDKLKRIQKDLSAYTIIFTANPKASWFERIYVDAFAGTGYRKAKSKDFSLVLPLFDDEEAVSFQKGSAQIALETDPPFHKYIFIDISSDFISELESLCNIYKDKINNIEIRQADANLFLQQWCRDEDWQRKRAVIFLDPYGMQVEWGTIESIANTKAIDLWILFPLGQAVNRLLTKKQPPADEWAECLTRFFGTETWKDVFYRKQTQMTLFGQVDSIEKDADFDSIGKYFNDRLKKVFSRVAENPLPLRNSKNIPIYLLCFASANPKGAPTAVKIAQHILGK